MDGEQQQDHRQKWARPVLNAKDRLRLCRTLHDQSDTTAAERAKEVEVAVPAGGDAEPTFSSMRLHDYERNH